jgi:hypothetical protein
MLNQRFEKVAAAHLIESHQAIFAHYLTGSETDEVQLMADMVCEDTTGIALLALRTSSDIDSALSAVVIKLAFPNN